VSVPDGAPAPEAKGYARKFDYLDSDALSGVQEWVIAVDADPPGRKLEEELVRRFGAERCRRVVWPQGCKDANEVLTRHGRDRLRECIEAALPYPLAGVYSPLSYGPDLLRLHEQGFQRGLSCGWDSLDELYTVRPCEVSVITGIPNAGKSNFLDAVLVNLAREHGWRFAICSPENHPPEDHIARLMEKWYGVPFYDGPTNRMTREDVAEATACLSGHFAFIQGDEDTGLSLEWILDRARALVRREGINGLVIDPWNELEHMRGPSLTETEYVSQCLTRVRRFARRHRIHIWIVAHPTKLYRDKEGNYPIPTLYDISGSAHWRNKADNGLCIWRDLSDPDSRVVEVLVQKIRFRQTGKLGSVELIFNPVVHTYHDKDKARDEIAPVYTFTE
jgi:twinkle protein